MPALVYNSKKVTLVFGGKIASGYADGDFLKITYAEDAVMLTMGTDGIGTISYSLNDSADLELTLMASSPFNDYLSAVYNDQRQGVIGLPMLMRDTGGTSISSAETMWITKMPDQTYSREVSERTWMLKTDRIVAFIGSNVSGQ